MDSEIWKPAPEVGPTYFVSNQGRVKNGDRILKGSKARGYISLVVKKEGRPVAFKIHRLVMSVFIGPSPLEVNHKNGIKDDNRLTNLEYVDRSTNMKHSYKIGLRKRQMIRNGNARLTVEQVQQIRRDYRRGNSQVLGEKYGVHQGTILLIVKGDRWKGV